MDAKAGAEELLARLQDAGYRVTGDQCEQALRTTEGDLSDAFAVVQMNYPQEMVSISSFLQLILPLSLKHCLTCEQVNISREAFPPNVRHLAFILGKSEELCAEALRLSENNFGGAVRLLLSARGAALETSLQSAEPKHQLVSRNRGRRDARMHSESSSAQSDMLVSYQELIDENPSYVLTDSSAVQAPQRFSRPGGSPHKGKPVDANGEFVQSEIPVWSECNSCFDDRVRSMNWHEVEEEEETLSQLLTAVHARKALSHVVRLFSKVRGS